MQRFTNAFRPTIRFFSTSSGFKFPKHKELFAEDYYEDGQGKTNPYQKPFVLGDDLEKFDKATHRSTQTGILSTYKK